MAGRHHLDDASLGCGAEHQIGGIQFVTGCLFFT
jgi:hypothetical protein